jgi:hypothetical protein
MRANGSDNVTTTTTALVNPAIPMSPSSSPLQQQQLHPVQDHSDSCSSCLWTGVVTCFGLSVYFAHIAFDEEKPITATRTMSPLTNSKLVNHQMNYAKHNTGSISSNGSNDMIRTWFQQQFSKYHSPPATTRYNKPVFLCISAGWFVVGLYRWHLG